MRTAPRALQAEGLADVHAADEVRRRAEDGDARGVGGRRAAGGEGGRSGDRGGQGEEEYEERGRGPGHWATLREPPMPWQTAAARSTARSSCRGPCGSPRPARTGR